MLKVAPNKPATIPKDIPKFNPIPHCTAGTMASTKIPYMAQRRIVSPNKLGTLNPSGAAIASINRKKLIIIILGSPKLS